MIYAFYDILEGVSLVTLALKKMFSRLNTETLSVKT